MFVKKKVLSIVSEIEIQQMVNAAATTIFSRAPSITYVNYQNFNKSYAPPKITLHYTSSELLGTSAYSNFFYCCTVHFDNIKILFTNKFTPLLNT